MTLFEECMLLKDFEKRENVLAEKVYTKMQERDDLEDKVPRQILITRWPANHYYSIDFFFRNSLRKDETSY